MKRSRLNPCRIKLHRSYTVADIERLFGVHKNTVRAWLKAGLPTIDNRRPVMIHGGDLRAFLEGRRQAGRVKCPPGTCYCLKCRAPRRPALDMADFIELGPASGNIRAICPECGTFMHRRAQRHRLDAVMPNIAVKLQQREQRLTDRA